LSVSGTVLLKVFTTLVDTELLDWFGIIAVKIVFFAPIMDGDGDLMGYLRRALMKMISLRGVQLEN
jgi:hypothetical protein